MKRYLQSIFTLITFALLATTSIQAEDQEKVVIALKTGDFELTETDISTLAIGEAQTIETESGKLIDILRTADGAEVYVDGELLELNFDDEGLHEEHVMIKDVEITCDNDEECDENILVHMSDEDIDIDIEKLGGLHEAGEGHKVIVIKKTEITDD